MDNRPCDVLVLHRAALGDFVLLWPMLRSLVRAGERVGIATDRGKALLAAEELGVVPIDIEQRRFNDLWVEGARPAPWSGVRRVISLIADPSTPAGRIWASNAAAMFPGAVFEIIPDRVDRPLALRLAGPGSDPPARHNPGGPLVAHVGAGSREKMWPLERWAELAAFLERAGSEPPLFIAGEAEAERFTPAERALFDSLRGRYHPNLSTLATLLRSARLFIGADSGPTHLATQLGVPTLALFGPTEPERWAPIGPAVRVIAPERPAAMTWLTPDRVAACVTQPHTRPG